MADLRHIVWKQQPIDDGWGVALDPVVWILVEALDADWCTSQEYVGHGGDGSLQLGRYEQFGKFFVGARFVTMSTVVLDNKGAVSFTNGRHRFAWLRDHGLATLPIEVPPSQAAIFTTRFGSSDRSGTVST